VSWGTSLSLSLLCKMRINTDTARPHQTGWCEDFMTYYLFRCQAPPTAQQGLSMQALAPPTSWEGCCLSHLLLCWPEVCPKTPSAFPLSIL
jgi:hypothetical protein